MEDSWFVKRAKEDKPLEENREGREDLQWDGRTVDVHLPKSARERKKDIYIHIYLFIYLFYITKDNKNN